MQSLTPLASLLAAERVGDLATSALPGAPVVPDVRDVTTTVSPARSRTSRLRAVSARGLRRLAAALEPALDPGPRCRPTH